MSEEREASVQLLKTFAPLDGLKRENLAALAKKVSVRTMPAGRILFKEGDTDKRTIWLVGGMVEIREKDNDGRHDPRRHARGAQPALPTDPAPCQRACGRRNQLPVDRQRAARRHDHLGSDRHLRSGRAAVAAGRRQQRRLDDDASADQSVPSDPAREHPGDLHAHAARPVSVGRGRHQAGR